METTFKFTTKEKYENFYNNLHEDLIDQDPIEQIMQTEGLATMISTRYKPKNWSNEKALKIMECLLYLFQDYEKYEECQSIIEAWPELKINA
tara:strand:- start:546 stop:821 length:276 start_codon:yes stop_codon:yes gene_type:complete